MALDGYYAAELEKVLESGLRDTDETIHFLARNVFHLYKVACDEANYRGRRNLEGIYEQIARTLPKCT